MFNQKVLERIATALEGIQKALESQNTDTPKKSAPSEDITEYEARTLLLWLEENHEESDFLKSLHAGIKKFRRLTPKQMSALKKNYIQIEGRGSLIPKTSEEIPF